jgi:peroxiredoxin
MKPVRISLTSILISTLLLSLIACSSSNSNSNDTIGKVTDYRSNVTQQIIKNGPAPDFQMQMPDGKIKFLSDLHGKVVLLNFWRINCPYCILEMPYLQEAYNELSADEVVILGINTSDSESAITKFLTNKKLSFPMIRDSNFYVSTLYQVRYVHTTYLIDKTGNIQIVKIGAFANAADIITALKALLQ